MTSDERFKAGFRRGFGLTAEAVLVLSAKLMGLFVVFTMLFPDVMFTLVGGIKNLFLVCVLIVISYTIIFGIIGGIIEGIREIRNPLLEYGHILEHDIEEGEALLQHIEEGEAPLQKNTESYSSINTKIHDESSKVINHQLAGKKTLDERFKVVMDVATEGELAEEKIYAELAKENTHIDPLTLERIENAVQANDLQYYSESSILKLLNKPSIFNREIIITTYKKADEAEQFQSKIENLIKKLEARKAEQHKVENQVKEKETHIEDIDSTSTVNRQEMADNCLNAVEKRNNDSNDQENDTISYELNNR